MKDAIIDDDLHAYVDGELDSGRRRQVEAFLATRWDKTAAVEDYHRQRIVLHRLFDRIEDRGLPDDMQKLAAQADRALRIGRLVRTGMRTTALCAAFAVVAVATTYSARIGQEQRADPLKDFRQQAIRAHLALGDDPLTADPAAEGAAISAPELNAVGLIPVARNLIAAGSGDALQIIYVDSDNSRVTLFVKSVEGGGRNTGTFLAENGVGQIYWRDAGIAFSLLGPADEETLSRIADAIGGVGAATFLLPGLSVNTAATAVHTEFEPVSEPPLDEIDVLPKTDPLIEGDGTLEETAPATQSRRIRPLVTVPS